MAPTFYNIDVDADSGRLSVVAGILIGKVFTTILVLATLVSCACCRKKKRKPSTKQEQVKDTSSSPTLTGPTQSSGTWATMDTSTDLSTAGTPSSSKTQRSKSYSPEKFWRQQAEVAPSFKLHIWLPEHEMPVFKQVGPFTTLQNCPGLSLTSLPSEEDANTSKSITGEDSREKEMRNREWLKQAKAAPPLKLQQRNGQDELPKSGSIPSNLHSVTVKPELIDEDKTIFIPSSPGRSAESRTPIAVADTAIARMKPPSSRKQHRKSIRLFKEPEPFSPPGSSSASTTSTSPPPSPVREADPEITTRTLRKKPPRQPKKSPSP